MRILLLGIAAVTLIAACADPNAPANGATVVAVTPSGGAVAVDPTTPISITFSHAMRAGTEMYAALHVDDLAGPVVSGQWTWSADRRMLTFTPAAPLASQTRHVVHLGGGMTDANGHRVNYDACAGRHGGQVATPGMMGGAMGGVGGMMGSAWQDRHGTYGMTFTFTTG